MQFRRLAFGGLVLSLSSSVPRSLRFRVNLFNALPRASRARHGRQRHYCVGREVEMDSKFEERKKEAFWGLFVADALAMPVHWYYRIADIPAGYGGWITGYRAPNEEHPHNFMSPSGIRGSGSSPDAKPIVGHVILHDKLQYWQSEASVHMHRGMSAGDSTLNALTALQTMKTMQEADPGAKLSPVELRGRVMENYVKFMTNPGSHEDTFAETYCRDFFRDWAAQKNPPRSAAELLSFCDERWRAGQVSEDSHLLMVGSLVLAVPWVLHYAHLSSDACAEETVEGVKLTHPAPSLMPFVRHYAHALHSVLHGADLRTVVLKTLEATELGGETKRSVIEGYIQNANTFPKGTAGRLEVYQNAGASLGLACGIQGALSLLLLIAAGFHDDFEQGVLTNVNVGGENVHRGAPLGALLAAGSVAGIPQKLKDGLKSAKPDVEKILTNKL